MLQLFFCSHPAQWGLCRSEGGGQTLREGAEKKDAILRSPFCTKWYQAPWADRLRVTTQSNKNTLYKKDDNPEYSVLTALKIRDGIPLDWPMMLFGWDKTFGKRQMNWYESEMVGKSQFHTDTLKLSSYFISSFFFLQWL